MLEVTFSAVNRGETYNQLLLSLLKEFERQFHIRVNLINADVKRSDLKSYAIYQRGPDVSEIATTWVNDMISMNALRPFSEKELARLGQAQDFAPGAWQTCHQVFDPHTWAIPFLMESVVIHYRSDLLSQAGLEPQQAFQSLAALHQMAERLAQSGVPVPVELPYWSLFDQLHALSGWVWSANGEYVSREGQRVLFDQPEVLAVMEQYFGLIRHYSPEGAHMALETDTSLFRQGKAAVTFSAHMLKTDLETLPAEVRQHWQVAPYPQEKYVGGSNVAIWKHSRSEDAALALVRYLASAEVQLALSGPSLQLPTRLEGLAARQIQADSLLSIAAQSAVTGRSYPTVPMWGLIEENLINALHAVQIGLLKDTAAQKGINETDVTQAVHNAIDPLARRMNVMLAR